MISLRLKPKINSLCRAFSKQIRMEPPQVANLGIVNENYTKFKSNQAKCGINTILFSPRSIGLNINMPQHPMIPVKEILDIPTLNKIIEIPFSKKIIEIIDQNRNFNELIEPPTSIENPGIQAARLIIIRRKKMKKHKLKKLRKKMKFEWAKVRQRREMRKEKAFQADLINQIKEAEKFSAEKYVSDKIAQSIEVPIPRFWKGKRLPQFLIKQKLGLK